MKQFLSALILTSTFPLFTTSVTVGADFNSRQRLQVYEKSESNLYPSWLGETPASKPISVSGDWFVSPTLRAVGALGLATLATELRSNPVPGVMLLRHQVGKTGIPELVAADVKLSALYVINIALTDNDILQISKSKAIKELVIDSPDGPTANALIHILDAPSLESLILSDIVNMTDDAMVGLKSSSLLKRMSVAGCPITAASIPLIASKFRNIEYLDVSDTEVAVLDGLSGLSKLTSLRASGCALLTEGAPALKQLTLLDLSSASLQDSHLGAIGQCTQLRSLDLAFNDITEAGLEKLQNLVSLEEVTLSHNPRLVSGLNLIKASSLKRVRLDGLPLSAEAFGEVIRWKDSLIEVSLNGNQTLSGTDLRVLRSLKKLQRLQLENTKISDTDLTAAALLDSLRSLRLTNTLISDSGLRNCIAQLEQLEELDLGKSGMPSLTSLGLDSLSALTRLKVLRIPGSGSVSDLGWLQHHKSLNILDLAGVPVDDQGAAQIGELANLRELYLDRNRDGDLVANGPGGGLTKVGTAKLGRLKALQTLSLRGHSRIESDGIESLASLTSLKKLILSNTGIDDQAVPSLGQLDGLLDLSVSGTRITQHGYRSLCARLPAARITWN